MEGAVQKFRQFLNSRGLPDRSPSNEGEISSIVAANYDSLTPDVMRGLVDCALEERDGRLAAGGGDCELLGSWGVIIDTFKEQTVARRERASANLQQMVAFGVQGEGDSALRSFVDELHKQGHVDSVLMDVTESSVNGVNEYEGNESVKNALMRIFHLLKQPPNVTFNDVANNKQSEEEFIAAGNLLRGLIQRNSGDAEKLKNEVTSRIQGTYGGSDSSISLSGPAFQKVLIDNIAACQKVGYANKVKFLEFLRHVIETATRQEGMDGKEGSGDHINHAPQFVDENRHDVLVSLVDEDDDYIDISSATEAFRFTATGSKSDKKSKGVNKKKKSIKASSKKKVSSTAETIGAHLEKHGWAVCDNAIPEDIVKRVRVEAGLFTEFYEQSEIWVGKKADVGAQLSVPSVRGDKVLWMCGGHKAVEGITRTVKTAGEVEPCRLEVKAQAPIRKFSAIRDLVATVDCLVYEMKNKCDSLGGLFERSDAMLAIYPGEGARFARHIDNTTRDGRRLTVLVYLNPDWSAEDGGALRIFSEKNDENDCACDENEEKKKKLRAVDVFPQGGRLAMFYSADIQHEVLPTYGERHSITLWYYDRDERKAAVESSQASGESKAAAESSIEAQKAAKSFISDLMGGDDIKEDGGLPSKEELMSLTEKLTQLDDETVSIISSITGAPSPASFREGFPQLSVEDLKQMRGLFRRMGLNDYGIG